MPIKLLQYADLSLLLATCIALGACQEKPRTASTDTASPAASTATGDAGANAPRATTPSPAPLSDANIVALLDEANMADSALGAAALPKAMRTDVKNFARLMMGEHHALRVQGQQLATAQHITPELPANDPFKAAVQDEQDAQAAAPKGHAFDATYIAKEIGIHQAVIGWAGTAESHAQNQALKDLIKAAGPVLQKHLDHALAIQKTLNTPTA